MPHILVESFKEPEMPFKRGGALFDWYADNLDHPGEGLFGVRVEGVPFLLQVKPKDRGFLIKGEKIARPSPNSLIKRALQAYIEETGAKVLYENISNLNSAKLVKPHRSLKEISSFDAASLPDKPLWIEVGFGSGRHLLHQAKENPDVHLIGLEIHRPSLEQVMRRIEIDSIENIWLVDYDARLFMELLPSDRVERVFVHFPVPWDKKPHRRVISKAFIDESLRVLRPGGTLELRTDSENYFNYSMELFASLDRVKLKLFKNMEAAVRSKYEDRWRRLEKNIYEIHLESLQNSEPRSGSYDFSFKSCRPISELFSQKPAKAIVKEEFFLHFERFYAINETEGLIRLSFGSFERPEHKYILLRNAQASYYPYAPVATTTNHRAHQKIREWIE